MGFFSNNVGEGLSNDLSSVKDAIGLGSKAKNSDIPYQLPWGKTSRTQNAGATPSGSVFMPPIDIDWRRWDQLYPYRLVVIDTSKGNTIVGGPTNYKPSPTLTKGSVDNYVLSFTPLLNQWIFSLPITPQQLNITDVFAVNTTATLRGVIEEHNGVKFKNITMAGTCGVWPYRETVVQSPSSPGLLKSFFGGTIEALGSVVSSATNTINALLNGSVASKPKTVHPELSQMGSSSTGYFLMLGLQQFLEAYAEMKKDPKNAGWRLVLDIPKQNQSLVVSPVSFTWSQNAQKPVEIDFSMQFKAWRRIKLQNLAAPANLTIQQVSPGLLQTILNTLTAARTVMASAQSLIAAVRSDVTAPLEILRQGSLLVKDTLGVVASAADLPKEVANDYSSAINQYLRGNSSSIQTGNTTAAVALALAAITTGSKQSEGLSSTAVSGGQIGNAAAALQNSSPVNQLYANFDANYTLFNAVPVTGLSLNTQQQNKLNTIFDQVRQLTVDDLKQYSAQIADLAYQIANYYGVSTAYYNQLYGKAPPNVSTQPIGLDEYQILNALYSVQEAFDLLTATNFFDEQNQINSMSYVYALANNAGITFDQSTSQIMVPVPYGSTIEAIASKYLNDPQRWLEIVTLNNLQEPYIDETGFQYYLLSNGIDRQITIASSLDLYVGQTVYLKSNTQTPSARTIIDIDPLPSGNVLISLDGLANLNLFTTTDQAYLQAYLPNTVNSQNTIFIPSDLPAQQPDNINIPANAQNVDLVGLSKVDFLLTADGDVATDNFGDFKISAGLTNLIQAIGIKIGTKQGSLINHPEFGLGVSPGANSADIDVNGLYNTINKLITDDPRYGGIKSLQIELNGAVLTINLTVFIANSTGVLPLTFNISA